MKSNYKISILYENQDIVVLDKPAGIVVNRSPTIKNEFTLQDWIEENIKDINFSVVSSTSDFFLRSGIVHRLDRQTSGVLIVAKSERVFGLMQKQFSKRKVKKEYLAVVYGRVEKNGAKFIEVDAPIKRSPRNREKFAVVMGGKEAVTRVKVIGSIKNDMGEFTLLKCFPKTGRTHQIRVHLAAMNHPVCGDMLYSGKARYRNFKEVFKRQMLHAEKIKFSCPRTGEKIKVESNPPEDMLKVINDLGFSY